MASEKIKITQKELDEWYVIEDEKDDKKAMLSEGDQATIEEVHEETWEEATERKDKDNKWLSE